jgi:energy-coupling factor transporter ATP-binding protein EcfA2
MRIDMALMLTWRSVAKLKNSINTNLLILDEIFDSSLDAGGADELMKILSLLEGNIFIISHRGDVLADKFSETIRFIEQQNFSRIV